MYEIVIASWLVVSVLTTQDAIVWGGDHVEMHVTAKGASIEFDCAHGTIDAPLKPDSKGHFELTGTFAPQHAGPVREDSSQILAATYTGTITQDAMSLRVTIAGKDAPPPMDYELVRGQAGNVRSCR
jgi:hypothetical protein